MKKIHDWNEKLSVKIIEERKNGDELDCKLNNIENWIEKDFWVILFEDNTIKKN